ETVEVWRTWLSNWDYDGPWEDRVSRSALALKLLVHEPNAAIIAAATTSLPERIGGDRNYDYRYMWVRDTAFTIDALMRLRLPEQCLDRLAVIWPDDDSGIWELDEHRSFTASNIASWMALDRGVRLAGEGHLPSEHVPTWREERDRARTYVEERCWSEEVGAY